MGRGQDYFLLGLARALESGTNTYLDERDRQRRLALAQRQQGLTEQYHNEQLGISQARLAQQGQLGAQRAEDYSRQVDLQEQGLEARKHRQAWLESQAQQKLGGGGKLPSNNAAANAIYEAKQAAGPNASLSDIAERLKTMGFDSSARAPVPPDDTADSAQKAIYEQRLEDFKAKRGQADAIQRWLNAQEEAQRMPAGQPNRATPMPPANMMPPEGMAPGSAPRETWGGPPGGPPPAPGGMKPLGMDQPRMPPIDPDAFAQAPQGPGSNVVTQGLAGTWARNFNIYMGLVPSTLDEYLRAAAWWAQNHTGTMPEHLSLMLNGPGGAPDMGGGGMMGGGMA